MTTRDRIINLLRDQAGNFVSGEEISRALNVSRAAVWKQIKALRDLGFTIEAKHTRGYRLAAAPDLLLAADIEQDLNCRILGRRILVLAETDSTNVQIRKLAEEGAPEGTVLIADRQCAGRGRLGRRWESPAKVNLYCSILLRPQIPVQQAPQLTFLSAVSVAETLQEICHLPAMVKWPNDVLIGRAKIAGLLNEMDAETERINYVVLGIGINLNMTREQFPETPKYPASSVLMETGVPVERGLFARTLLQRLDEYYCEFVADGFGAIRSRWEGLCNIMNQRVEVDCGADLLRGTVVGIDPQGALRLQREDGTIERIMAGDVRPVDD